MVNSPGAAGTHLEWKYFSRTGLALKMNNQYLLKQLGFFVLLTPILAAAFWLASVRDERAGMRAPRVMETAATGSHLVGPDAGQDAW